MTRVVFGNHSAMRVHRAERDQVRAFYRDVLGGEIVRQSDGKDDIRLGGTFYLAVLYEDAGAVLAEDDLLKATYLELRADDVAQVRQRIVDFGVKLLDIPDSHLYFQAPGGQVFRLTGIDEDLSKYEGTEHGQQFVGTAFTAAAPGDQR